MVDRVSGDRRWLSRISARTQVDVDQWKWLEHGTLKNNLTQERKLLLIDKTSQNR
jgi:hypothetical protein